jgi:hypothetical protein
VTENPFRLKYSAEVRKFQACLSVIIGVFSRLRYLKVIELALVAVWEAKRIAVRLKPVNGLGRRVEFRTIGRQGGRERAPTCDGR